MAILSVSSAICFAKCCAQPDCPSVPWPPTAFIYGQAGWYSTGDVVQFVGDSNLSNPGGRACSALSYVWGHCWIDYGFTFRKVTNFDPDECTYTASSTCDVAQAPCCLFWADGSMCTGCSDCCGDFSLCMSFWEVVAYHADGSTGRGCWELDYVSDCTDEECENGLGMCSAVRHWWD